jgi:hypothetical protein
MTAQISDRILFEGRRRYLASEPLSSWLARKKNKHMHFRRQNSAVSRGYRAAWEVARGRLYLTHFAADLPDGTPATMDMLFANYTQEYLQSVGADHPSNAGPGRFAFWFTGGLCCPFGAVIEYDHSGYDSVTEGELILWFKEGFLIGTRIVRNERSVRQGLKRKNLSIDEDIEADLEGEQGQQL